MIIGPNTAKNKFKASEKSDDQPISSDSQLRSLGFFTEGDLDLLPKILGLQANDEGTINKIQSELENIGDFYNLADSVSNLI